MYLYSRRFKQSMVTGMRNLVAVAGCKMVAFLLVSLMLLPLCGCGPLGCLDVCDVGLHKEGSKRGRAILVCLWI